MWAGELWRNWAQAGEICYRGNKIKMLFWCLGTFYDDVTVQIPEVTETRVS